MKKKLILIFAAAALIGISLRLYLSENQKPTPNASNEIETPVAENQDSNFEVEKSETASEIKTENKAVQESVPFVVQAPFGNWSDPVFQNACEEASIVMANGWLENENSITPTEAQNRILKIVDFENSSFGYNADTDVEDIKKIFENFFDNKNISAQENISLDDLKKETEKGNIVLVPAYGRALKNPYYTSPGPIAHMLTIVGYDKEKKQFITNDPGTRRGQGYRYDEKILFDAIWSYPSGKDSPEPPGKTRKKSMLVIARTMD